MNVDLDQSLTERLERGDDILELLAELGDGVALDAKVFAPKRTGGLANSIFATTGEDETGAYVRIGWDDQHFYGKFVEQGTSKMRAQPFLRPALYTKRAI